MPNEEEPAADAQPPETKPVEPEVNVQAEPPAPSTPDDLPLLQEAHIELDKMVTAARRAGRLESALKQLRSLVAFCVKTQLQYEAAASP
jgi:hypothetical protein